VQATRDINGTPSPAFPLRILNLASHSTCRRGGAIQMSLLAAWLNRNGHTAYCMFNSPPEVERNKAEEDLRHFCENAGEACFIPMHPFWAGYRALRDFIREKKIDIVHAHREEALIFAFFCRLFGAFRAPLVFQRGTEYRIRKFSPSYFALKSGFVKKIIAVSQAVKNSLVKCGINPAKVEVIYGGVDLKRFSPDVSGSPILKFLGFPPGAFVFGNIASLAPKKGYDIFFKAAAQVSAKIPGAYFLVAGDGPFQKFIPLLGELGIREKVKFLGFRRDIENVIAALHVLVCSPTKGEGLTGAIREGLAMKKPVIATDVAGNGEFIIHDRTGLLVEPGSVDALAGAMIQSYNDYERMIHMAESGYRMVCREADNDIRCRRVVNLYREALGI